jgi:ParB family chromosome partitioning protein
VLAGLKTPRDQKALRDLVLKKGLTVRQAEEQARRLSASRPSGPSSPPSEEDETLRALADNLKRSLGTKVDIRKRGRRGRITIHFYSDEELERLLDRLG